MDRRTKKRGAGGPGWESLGELLGSEVPDQSAAVCDWPGCRAGGLHRAPRSRQQMRAYHWFCLEHVRIFNKSWNYYRGMNEAEVEASIRSDTIWNRPSWPLGSLGGAFAHRARAERPGPGGKKNHWFGRDSDTLRDPFGFWGRDDPPDRTGDQRRAPAEERALRILDLKFPVTVAEVKARYKILVKRYHPDVNRGDKTAEERLKHINQAYETVMNCLAS